MLIIKESHVTTVFVTIAILFFCWSPSFSQGLITPENPQLQSPKNLNFDLDYTQNNNIYLWKGLSSWQKSFSRGSFVFQNDFDINRIKSRVFQDKWKDSNRLNAQMVFALNEKVTTVLNLNSNYLSDRQSGFLNNITEHNLKLQLPVNLFENVYSVPLVGVKWDKRTNNADKGYQYGMDVNSYERTIGGYNTEAMVYYLTENLSSRKNSTQRYSLSVNRMFYDETADTLNYMQTIQRRDYYVSVFGERETRKENMKNLQNSLTYKLFSRTKLKINSGIMDGVVDIISSDRNRYIKRKDRELSFDIFLDSNINRHSGRLFIKYKNSRQRHFAENDNNLVFGSVPYDIPDNSRKQLAVGLSMNGMFAKKHNYKFRSQIEKFQYDTPLDTDYSDRDEIRYVFSGTYSYIFNPDLKISVNGLASLEHLIYIFGQRSADNNWNRVFKTGTVVEYANRSDLRIRSEYSVLANYVDYDFDDLFVQTRSFVFRKFLMRQTLSLPVSYKSRIEGNFSFEIEENGLLRWDEFVQNILFNRKIISSSVSYNYMLLTNFQVIPGISTFSRSEEHPQAQTTGNFRNRWSKIRDFGVSLDMIYFSSQSSQIKINLSKRFIRRGDVKENFQYVDLSLNWFL
ncbi:hypothetical protein ACFL7D_00105 [candidate division KSB1 bacterium]